MEGDGFGRWRAIGGASSSETERALKTGARDGPSELVWKLGKSES